MYKNIVWTVVTDQHKVLLLKKPDDSEWTLVGGHVEDEESSKMAAIREAKEELGIDIAEDDLEVLCVIDRKLDKGYKVHICYKSNKWQGQPVNKEQDVHSEIKWFELSNLPQNVGVLAKAAIDSMETKKLYHFKDHVDHHNKH